MGTTLTLAYRLNDMLFVAHVGDSRCYLFRNRLLYRLTRDHTLVEEMVRRGALNAQEAAHHQWRHVVTNAVGGNSAEVTVEVHKVHLEAGDVVLLCSDGLTNMVPDEEIARRVISSQQPRGPCRVTAGMPLRARQRISGFRVLRSLDSRAQASAISARRCFAASMAISLRMKAASPKTVVYDCTSAIDWRSSNKSRRSRSLDTPDPGSGPPAASGMASATIAATGE
jgi:protein phosphatase